VNTGIVDILQQYTWQKRLERFFKTRILRRARAGVSTMSPDDYATRFVNMVASTFS
jgi:hypothetical protein